MAKRKDHQFQNKLILNQWLLSLLGIDPFKEYIVEGQRRRPFHILKDALVGSGHTQMEGMDHNNRHYFFHDLQRFLLRQEAPLTPEKLEEYEDNISRHTQRINRKRRRQIHWKYYQWLSLVFLEIYLDRYFHDREGLLEELNAFVERFNDNWSKFKDIEPYRLEELNKICFQMATGSGKTLIMHANLLQFQHYAEVSGAAGELSRAILITPNERLSTQHIAEMSLSGLGSSHFAKEGFNLLTQARGLERVDVIEISKLGDEEKANTIETRSLGGQNLLLVDEGHRGLGSGTGKDLGSWMARRGQLAERGFTIEYSATFSQAVANAKSNKIVDDYARSILFDYSYRWFYEDGYGKDYKIDNLPKPDGATLARIRKTGSPKTVERLENQAAIGEALMPKFLTAALLKFYQQLRIYEEKFEEGPASLRAFHLEKPLWVFVGSSVTSGKTSKDEKKSMSDVGNIVSFFADFAAHAEEFIEYIDELIDGTGEQTGLIDEKGRDIFDGAFSYLSSCRASNNEGAADIYRDILHRVFHNRGGGKLKMERITAADEVALRLGNAEKPFGLISVGEAKKLCDHVEEALAGQESNITISTSEFSEAQFDEVKKSSSPFHLLLGSKKFIEGWDCWRVSTLGLMHVGKKEGVQIIQLFGRGVRLKGYEWSLKRSQHVNVDIPEAIRKLLQELETLNVFGVEATYMENFRNMLKEEGLPGNEEFREVTIPLNITFDFGKKLKILRPKKKRDGGGIYEFKVDGPVPTINGGVPEKLRKVVVDRYPRILAYGSRKSGEVVEKQKRSLNSSLLELLDYDELYFELERYKADRSWYNLNISKEGIRELLAENFWYELYIPKSELELTSFAGVRRLKEVALALLKRYVESFYNYHRRAYIEPRMEIRELTREDANIPDVGEYTLTVDASQTELVQQIEDFAMRMKSDEPPLERFKSIEFCNFNKHLFEPLLHVAHGTKLTIRPVALNASEFKFVKELKEWCEAEEKRLEKAQTEIYLLRNLSRGKGIGFFEASGFHPDFIMWILKGDKQYVTFVDPHGLQHTGAADAQIEFGSTIKDVEKRLADRTVILNSFILSPTEYRNLGWSETKAELEAAHVLFMEDEDYLERLFRRLGVLAIEQSTSEQGSEVAEV